jgi:hypothetical protein
MLAHLSAEDVLKNGGLEVFNTGEDEAHFDYAIISDDGFVYVAVARGSNRVNRTLLLLMLMLLSLCRLLRLVWLLLWLLLWRSGRSRGHHVS